VRKKNKNLALLTSKTTLVELIIYPHQELASDIQRLHLLILVIYEMFPSSLFVTVFTSGRSLPPRHEKLVASKFVAE
jgi:hypothetical protein